MSQLGNLLGALAGHMLCKQAAAPMSVPVPEAGMGQIAQRARADYSLAPMSVPGAAMSNGLRAGVEVAHGALTDAVKGPGNYAPELGKMPRLARRANQAVSSFLDPEFGQFSSMMHGNHPNIPGFEVEAVHPPTAAGRAQAVRALSGVGKLRNAAMNMISPGLPFSSAPTRPIGPSYGD